MLTTLSRQGGRRYGQFHSTGPLSPAASLFTVGSSAIPATVAATVAGVHRVPRSRFLRRAPKLPWDEAEKLDVKQEPVVAKSRRKQIRLPKAVVEAIAPIQIEKVKELPAVEITLPSVGIARLDNKSLEDEDDLVIWMM